MKGQSINFKWNPFTLKGEAPASLRFLPEGDSLEFATKEDLEIIKNDPNLSKVHQAMLAGVNKKFQSWAEENKGLKQQIATLQGELQELDSSLREWEDFFSQHRETILKAIQGGDIQDSISNQNHPKKKGTNMETDDRYNQLIEQFQIVAQEFERRLHHLGNMLNLSIQLNDVMRRNPEADPMKILDAALKGKISDLNQAYKMAYEDELINKQVEERLKPRVDEELAKRTTNVETGSGAVPINFELPKELPKSMQEAGHQFLKERAEEASKP